jgi:succinate dehydrogenase / fumarate reductase flavoprotein subunit
MAELLYVKGYPEYMRGSIELVEKSRKTRVGKLPPQMTMEERQEVLDLCHPDYAPGGKREISIGPNKGEVAPNEVVDLLESLPLVELKELDLSEIDYDPDILIIGGGLAGTSAALLANDQGVPVDRILLTTKLRHGDANSIMAQGGTQVADRPNDSPVMHYIDTIGGGHFTNKPDVVKALVEDGPKVVKWLSELGATFDRNEDGSFVELSGGGASRKRMHACEDYTGLEELRVIRDEFRSRKIPCLEHSPIIELLTDGKRVTGGVIYNLETGEYKVARAKAVILTTGGFGRLHIRGFPTTNHYGACGDGVVLAYRAGAKLRDMDSVQYHPTGAAYPQQIIGLLLTEKLRTAGAQVINRDGEAFVFPLEPRDVESSAIIRECYVNDLGITTPTGLRGVWLDTPMIDVVKGDGYTRRSFPAMVRMFNRFGIDMTVDPVLIFPTLHYQNGGVETDPWGRTNLDGLWVAGEVSGGVHGKNRLMGNSTLDALVFGRRAGIDVARRIKSMSPMSQGKLTLDHALKYTKMLREADIKTERRAPVLLPDYRGKLALARMIDIM